MSVREKGKTLKKINFDMDGTIADLYGIDGWLDMLIAEDATPYIEAAPMYDMDYLNAVMAEFIMRGWDIEVITWTSMNSSATYHAEVAAAKTAWIEKFMPCVSTVHCVAYGTPKHEVSGGILIDDNAEVRADWDGITIDATQDIIESLLGILENL